MSNPSRADVYNSHAWYSSRGDPAPESGANAPFPVLRRLRSGSVDEGAGWWRRRPGVHTSGARAFELAGAGGPPDSDKDGSEYVSVPSGKDDVRLGVRFAQQNRGQAGGHPHHASATGMRRRRAGGAGGGDEDGLFGQAATAADADMTEEDREAVYREKQDARRLRRLRRQQQPRRHKRRHSDPEQLAHSLQYGRHVRPLVELHRPKESRLDRFRWGVVISRFGLALLIVAVTTALVYALSRYDYFYLRRSYTDWNNILFPPELAPYDHIDHEVDLITQRHVVSTLQQFLLTYFVHFKNNSVNYVEYHYGADGVTPDPVFMTVRYDDSHFEVDGLPKEKTYLLKGADDLGPLKGNNIKFFEHLLQLSIKFKVMDFDLSYERFCLDWSIRYDMTFDDPSRLTGRLHFDTDFCAGMDPPDTPSRVLVLFIIICAMSCLSLLFLMVPVFSWLRKSCWSWRECTDAFCPDLRRRWRLSGSRSRGDSGLNNYRELSFHEVPGKAPRYDSYAVADEDAGEREAAAEVKGSEAWDEKGNSSGSDKDNEMWVLRGAAHFFKYAVPRRIDFWWGVALACDICNIVMSAGAIQRRMFYHDLLSGDVQRLFMATGCLLAWLRLIPPVQSLGPKYSVMVRTMNRSGPFLTKFCAGIMPVFLGFVFFGVAAYSIETRKFENTDMSAMSLFSIMMGDMIFDTYHDLGHYANKWMSEVFLYVFITLFIMVVGKLALAGVEYFYFVTVPPTSVINYGEEVYKKEVVKVRQHQHVQHARYVAMALDMTRRIRPHAGMVRRETAPEEVPNLMDSLHHTFSRVFLQNVARNVEERSQTCFVLAHSVQDSHHPAMSPCPLQHDCLACALVGLQRQVEDDFKASMRDALSEFSAM